MARFSGKTVIITGSSNGIGRTTALLFAKDGANVTITGRNADRLEETRQQILHAGVSDSQINVVSADITQPASQDEIINSTLKKFGRIDVLVNNAGAAIPDAEGKMGTDQGVDTYRKIFHLNVQTVIEMTQKVKPHLIATKGEIVNVSSIVAGPQAQPDTPYYAISKAALDQYTRSTAIDLIQHGIRVNSVSPGAVATGFIQAMGLPEPASQKMYDYMAAHKDCIPAGFCGKPEHIANIILFLADRNLSTYIIGQSIVADGGTSLIMGANSHDLAKIIMSP